MISKKFVNIRCYICCIVLYVLVLTIQSFAGDSNVRISNVRITVSDALKNLELNGNEQLPSLSENDFTVPDNNQYEITNVSWVGNDDVSIGNVPKVEVYLTSMEKERSNDYYTYYYFSGTYNSSNVHVNGGTFVSARAEGNYALRVVLALKGIKGTFPSPSAPEWSNSVLGLAMWSAPAGTSGFYKVSLLKDSQKVCNIITDQTSLNLYPYMTKAGGYYFEVSTIPYTSEQIKGKESEIIQSSILNIDIAETSDGSGQYADSKYLVYNGNVISDSQPTGTSTSTAAASTDLNSGTSYTVYNSNNGQTTYLQGYGNNTNTSGTSASASTSNNTGNWYKEGNYWYFRMGNGSNVCNEWLLWKNQYYRFDESGKMLTGFYKKDDYATYYLGNSGAMKTGWVLINNAWYFMNPEPGEYYGLMYRKAVVDIGNKSYFFDSDGRMRTGWVIIKDGNGIDQYYYFYPKTDANGNDYGYMAKSTTVLDGFTIAADGHWVH